ncbi:histone-lysine N-methyltransferase SETMAR [Plakobranchus ocellatus]|uniref:Histone-lysine N-methyltransferase SETMAR n=1 Tax=Plakobranchus ocellatus TaxID=259542 RepID=A0AAV3Z3F6_9GAST|nr:histone-lysine N-methyltransferase SETMAR [Plakobranchus ocellatus]
MSRSRVYQWCTWFGKGRTSLGDEPKSGRPKTSTNEENTTRVDELIRCDRRMKIREIALKLKIPTSTVHEIVHDTLGYRKVSARWVPKMLTEDHKLQRVEISQRLLQRCQQDNGDEDTMHIGVGPGRDFQANNNLFDNLIIACLVDESADVTGTTVDCSNYYNAKLDTNTDLTYCCEDANRRPKFQEINIDSGTTLFSCMCLPHADARVHVGDEDDDDDDNA